MDDAKEKRREEDELSEPVYNFAHVSMKKETQF